MKSRILALAIASALYSSLGNAMAGNPELRFNTGAATSHLAQPKTKTSSRTQQYSGLGYCREPGWSAAHVKRMAKKASNRARNKAAYRRAGR